ncbi:hypothetical protein GIB67_006403 [Kingdonia uniflora]|uniref:Ubiquitin-like domain-containing protein n=1 Tax=Kingdonia uniflora TaxID=39325 RepID=A0A7J7P0Q7_9MAGN|nr:hypothetical protein GIB67_006403 [Kingdonia uniflora]
MEVYNVLVKLLDGKTATLRFKSPIISGETLKTHLYNLTQIPPQHQRLLTGTHQINHETLITLPKNGSFTTIHLLLRLIGGKGGFGSLLRGAATKAGQKKTNNFDACRDMSGRRLRHVNAEKKLEEWRAGADDRNLEKIAEEYIKKKMKAIKKSGSGESEKYVQKYREDSLKCVEGVEASVRESLKRSMLPTESSSSKKLKLWMMKEKVDDSDSSDEDEDETHRKTFVLDDANRAVKFKDGEGTSGSVSGIQSDGESSGDGSTHSNLGESSGSGVTDAEANGLIGPGLDKDSDNQSTCISNSRLVDSFESRPVVNEASGFVEEANVGIVTNLDLEEALKSDDFNSAAAMESTVISSMEVVRSCESRTIITEANNTFGEVEVGSTKSSDLDKPLNFDDFESASEMEVLGLDRLKSELQVHGLKCGGTLQERAARLFLLKTTPVDMLPKKLLAKK